MSRRDVIRSRLDAKTVTTPAPHWLDPALGPCRLWTGGDSGTGRGGGYGRVKLDGITQAVHIVSWTNENGILPSNKHLDHLCRRRNCRADLHLEMVTPKQNQQRRAAAAREAVRWAVSTEDMSEVLLCEETTGQSSKLLATF